MARNDVRVRRREEIIYFDLFSVRLITNRKEKIRVFNFFSPDQKVDWSRTVHCTKIGKSRERQVRLSWSKRQSIEPLLGYRSRYEKKIEKNFFFPLKKRGGGTLNRLGLLLPQPVFSHGQLYVAFSRVRSLASIRVLIIGESNNHKPTKTRNVVFPEVL